MRGQSLQSDKELILAARNGSDAAFTELVGRYDRRVLSIIAKYCQCSDEAKDIYQDVFIRVYKSLGKFAFQSEFPTWLFRITTNVCLSYYSTKRNKRNIGIPDEDDDNGLTHRLIADSSDSPEIVYMDSETTAILQAALRELPPQQRLVFTLKHVEGMKLKEMAKLMNCAEGTVKKYLFLAVEKLRVRLQPTMKGVR